MLVFRAPGTKATEWKDGVLFIDTSARFTKAKNRNVLTDVDIANVVTAVLLQERVVESAVSMAGRTKMPKVNRKQLFSIQVAMPCPDSIASVDAALSALRGHREAVVAEAARLREVRVGLLAGLLDRTIEIESAELGV
ncbi:restriction endonuclease subunit S [Streptomyces massasporeus]